MNRSPYNHREVRRPAAGRPSVPILLCLAMLLAGAGSSQAFNCTLATTPIAFGVYDVFSSFNSESTGTLTVDCKNPEKKPLMITISLNPGSSGRFNPRQMSHATSGDRLNYYLFTNSSKSAVWGDGTGGTSTVSSVISRSEIFTATIYSVIPAGQDVTFGTYSDLVTATVIW